MPELPEVETVRRHLDQHIGGQQVVAVELKRPDLRYPMPVAAVHALAGQRIRAVERRAKYLLLGFSGAATAPQVALVHLGMSGRLFVEPAASQVPFAKHEHWRWTLDGPKGAQLLRYVDPRRFGALDVIEEGAPHPLLASLGPEPLGPSWDGRTLWQACRSRQSPIKQVLMDPSVVVGIGNIYVSETCFRAAIDPRRPADKVKQREAVALVQAARDVLEEAVAAGGSTLRDFVGGDQAPGYFQQRLDVYGRQGAACPRCAAAIERAVLGQRATYWCARCQR